MKNFFKESLVFADLEIFRHLEYLYRMKIQAPENYDSL